MILISFGSSFSAISCVLWFQCCCYYYDYVALRLNSMISSSLNPPLILLLASSTRAYKSDLSIQSSYSRSAAFIIALSCFIGIFSLRTNNASCTRANKSAFSIQSSYESPAFLTIICRCFVGKQSMRSFGGASISGALFHFCIRVRNFEFPLLGFFLYLFALISMHP